MKTLFWQKNILWHVVCAAFFCLSVGKAAQGKATQPDFLYQRCTLSAGKIVFCFTPFSGQAALYKEESGNIELCQLSIGRVLFCSGLYTGQMAVKEKRTGDTYNMCQVSAGRITFCGGPYTGEWVVKTP